ncbi:hypothetical protein VCR4J2_770024 [Vibrio coralliirubri]|nr:hypothetical protein VCR4J2_770024 [Vibrio coralliirubri]
MLEVVELIVMFTPALTEGFPNKSKSITVFAGENVISDIRT